MWYRDFSICFASLSLSLKNFGLEISQSLCQKSFTLGWSRKKCLNISLYKIFGPEYSVSKICHLDLAVNLGKVLKLFLTASITGAVCLIHKRK